jgi:hypothetical protein
MIMRPLKFWLYIFNKQVRDMNEVRPGRNGMGVHEKLGLRPTPLWVDEDV